MAFTANKAAAAAALLLLLCDFGLAAPLQQWGEVAKDDKNRLPFQKVQLPSYLKKYTLKDVKLAFAPGDITVGPNGIKAVGAVDGVPGVKVILAATGVPKASSLDGDFTAGFGLLIFELVGTGSNLFIEIYTEFSPTQGFKEFAGGVSTGTGIFLGVAGGIKLDSVSVDASTGYTTLSTTNVLYVPYNGRDKPHHND